MRIPPFLLLLLLIFIFFLLYFSLCLDLCGWPYYYRKRSSFPSKVQSSLKYLISYEEFRSSKLLSWNWSCSNQTRHLTRSTKICLGYSIPLVSLGPSLSVFLWNRNINSTRPKVSFPVSTWFLLLHDGPSYLSYFNLPHLPYSVQVLSQLSIKLVRPLECFSSCFLIH